MTEEMIRLTKKFHRLELFRSGYEIYMIKMNMNMNRNINMERILSNKI